MMELDLHMDLLQYLNDVNIRPPMPTWVGGAWEMYL